MLQNFGHSKLGHVDLRSSKAGFVMLATGKLAINDRHTGSTQAGLVCYYCDRVGVATVWVTSSCMGF